MRFRLRFREPVGASPGPEFHDENRVFQLINGFSMNPTRKRGKVSSPRLRVGLVFSSACPLARLAETSFPSGPL